MGGPQMAPGPAGQQQIMVRNQFQQPPQLQMQQQRFAPPPQQQPGPQSFEFQQQQQQLQQPQFQGQQGPQGQWVVSLPKRKNNVLCLTRAFQETKKPDLANTYRTCTSFQSSVHRLSLAIFPN